MVSKNRFFTIFWLIVFKFCHAEEERRTIIVEEIVKDIDIDIELDTLLDKNIEDDESSLV